jgi:hypothetical protein
MGVSLIKTVIAASMLVAGLGAFKIDTAHAAVPTVEVCKSFAAYAIRWNTRARQIRCPLPAGANFHFDERQIFAWCMGRPNDDRSPLGHRDILEKHCRRRL